LSNIDYENDVNKINDQQKEEEVTANHNNKLVTEFTLTEKPKTLGILRIAKEHNTVVVAVKNGETKDDPFVIRRAIDFKDWNGFIKSVKDNLQSDLKFEFDKKELSRIIAYVETILNKNYDAIKIPAKSHEADMSKDNTSIDSDNTKQASSEYDTEQEPIPFLAINQLVRKQAGTFKTKGTAVSVTPIRQAITKVKWNCWNNGECANPYNERVFDSPLLRLDGSKLRCHSCFEPILDVDSPAVVKEWVNYVIIEIQDNDSPVIDDDLQKLTTIVFDKYIDNVRIGQTVEVCGNIRVPLKSHQKPYFGRTINSSLSSVFYAESITSCEQKEEINITEKDIAAFQRFIKYPNLMDRLASIVATNVVGHEDKKIAIVLAAAGAPENPKQRNKRGRIHVLLVGPPGTAKTTLSDESVNLRPNSRFTAAQTSSAKTIIAIVEVQGDTKIIKYGAVPLSKDAICVIDEIGAMSFDDQVSLFRHGEVPLNKQGESRIIPAHTTIIGTSNPKNIDASWSKNSSGKISKEEIPLRRALVDRFDIVLMFSDEDTEESANKYAIQKMKINQRANHNYRYIRKYLHYIRNTITQVTFTKEAQIMIANYYAFIKTNKSLLMTPRALETLTRMCQAWARLHLKCEVDADIVNQVQSYFSIIMLQYGEVIKAAVDPREVACEQIIEIIKRTVGPILFEEAARQACECNQVVKDYLGSNLKLRDNNRLHEVSERIREYSNIRVVGLRPLVLEWIKQSPDASSQENKGSNFKDGT
jgi:DNA replicative helicase MCM subunit Mcm2 (Cdc46/Mcm family)